MALIERPIENIIFPIFGVTIMKGPEFFSSVNENLARYSLIPYLCGHGILKTVEGNEFPIEWEMSLSICGEVSLYLSTNSFISPMIQVESSGQKFRELILNGQSNDGVWIINSNNVIIPGFEASTNDSIGSVLRCRVRQLSLQKQGPLNTVKKIRGYIQNLNEGSFTANVNGKEYRILPHEQLGELIDTSREKNIPSVISSSIETSISSETDITSTWQVIDELSWMISLATLNMCYIPVQLHLDQNDAPVHWIATATASNAWRKDGLINNSTIPGGLKLFLGSCYEHFVALDKGNELRILVSLILDALDQRQIDSKLDGIIRSTEHFSSMLLKIYDANRYVTLYNMSVNEKLNALNRYFRFIRADGREDTLRSEYRNPLFHQGHLAHLPTQDKMELVNILTEILVQILLASLRYNGKYLNPNGWSICTVPSVGVNGKLPPI